MLTEEKTGAFCYFYSSTSVPHVADTVIGSPRTEPSGRRVDAEESFGTGGKRGHRSYGKERLGEKRK